MKNLPLQEETRWSADAIPIRNDGMRDLTHAIRRVGLARIHLACKLANLQLNLSAYRDSKSPSIVESDSVALMEVVEGRENANQSSDLDDSVDDLLTDAKWRVEADDLIRSYDIEAATFDADISSKAHQKKLSAPGRLSSKTGARFKQTNRGTKDFHATTAISSDKTKSNEDLSKAQRHLGATLVSKGLLKCSDLGAKERAMINLTNQYPSSCESLSQTLGISGAISLSYKAAYCSYKQYRLSENALSIYLEERARPSATTIPISALHAIDADISKLSLRIKRAMPFTAKLRNETTLQEGSQELMYGVSQSVIDGLADRWLQKAQDVWTQWFQIHLYFELSRARCELRELHPDSPPAHLHLLNNALVWRNRFDCWWYEAVYLRLPRNWRGYAMSPAYKFHVSATGASDSIVSANRPSPEVSACHSIGHASHESPQSCLAVCGIQTYLNPDVPILLREFVTALTCMAATEGGDQSSDPAKVLLSPSVRQLDEPIFQLNEVCAAQTTDQTKQLNPTSIRTASEQWQVSTQSYAWAVALSSNQSDKPLIVHRADLQAKSAPVPMSYKLRVPVCASVDAYVSGSSTAVSALFVIFHLVRSACAVQVASLWQECRDKTGHLTEETLFLHITEKWTSMEFAKTLKGLNGCSPDLNSDEESNGNESIADTREFNQEQVFGEIPDYICWPPELADTPAPPETAYTANSQPCCYAYDSLFLEAARPFGPGIEVLWELAIKLRNPKRLPLAEARAYCRLAARIAYGTWHELVVIGGLEGLKLVEVTERHLFQLAVGDMKGSSEYGKEFENAWNASLEFWLKRISA